MQGLFKWKDTKRHYGYKWRLYSKYVSWAWAKRSHWRTSRRIACSQSFCGSDVTQSSHHPWVHHPRWIVSLSDIFLGGSKHTEIPDRRVRAVGWMVMLLPTKLGPFHVCDPTNVWTFVIMEQCHNLSEKLLSFVLNGPEYALVQECATIHIEGYGSSVLVECNK